LHEALEPPSADSTVDSRYSARGVEQPPAAAPESVSSPAAPIIAMNSPPRSATDRGNGVDPSQALPVAPATSDAGAPVQSTAAETHGNYSQSLAPHAAAPARPRIIRQAFALVDQVSENSPASAAGILVGDEFLVVGAVSVRALGS
jgi:hypothetical protein